MTLYHFTCSHLAEHIREEGFIVPQPIIGMTSLPSVVWLTDLADPRPQQLGFAPLTSVGCDRMEVRFDLDIDAVRWKHFAKTEETLRVVRRELQRRPGADPYRWFVTTEPIPIGDEDARD